ncbi:NAD(P)-binding domain-containing protein [Halogeometricum borinquense]|uniref:K+ transport system, NAD-binding component,exopolyphosphatase-like enzyme n=2 Tax=Halogeometricum borinquense TaxID=60847 RepID=E4NTP2_HALBP|nr:DHH family phosphoesterase [Halogeometricum borinquense]ADQ67094.1 K+ transport system, NAD-binding component,exopolyphosphatase-like enzyme [Halogeometricum borinquense DSM 11551]ELY29640.1 k+ transporter, NAD-binding protein [Halogeometricum borinquense DSM 11551]QIB74658.1 NAD(P)-binding domain-containing protein [Halogeometricum borinquense]QIQ76389.1 NAD(P)-binding domain-containing protein [Halogeometricum borinquense]RYJ13941.1 phosphoesterase [Halogeometricum borinquense]
MSAGVTISSMSTYAILGCGSVGHAVAEELTEEGKDVLILDKDESRVEALRDQDLNAQTTDISDPEVSEAVAERDVVLILASDVEANKAAVSAIRERNSDQFIVVRASDPVSEDELAELGADVVINPSEVIADSALRSLESGELEYKARQLADLLESTEGKLAILTHDNPDPDSIASAAALQAIAAEYDVEADILYDGEMGHQENRAFVNLLGIDLTPLAEAPDLREYGSVALVDHMKSVEPDIGTDVDIFIDHFEPGEGIDPVFIDVRPNVSSTSTILTKYIQEFNISPSEAVATALLYGIRAETLDFKRETTPADLTAAAYLYPFADHDTLEQVESPSMSPETLDVLAEAIQNRDVQGSHLVSNAGFIRDRDALGQAAQHLLNLEGVTTTAVFGIVDDNIYLSARSKDIRMNIGNVLQDAFEGIGEAGGHSTQGDVEIPLGIFTGIETSDDNRDTLLQLTEEAVRRKLFAAMGVESESGNGS